MTIRFKSCDGFKLLHEWCDIAPIFTIGIDGKLPLEDPFCCCFIEICVVQEEQVQFFLTQHHGLVFVIGLAQIRRLICHKEPLVLLTFHGLVDDILYCLGLFQIHHRISHFQIHGSKNPLLLLVFLQILNRRKIGRQLRIQSIKELVIVELRQTGLVVHDSEGSPIPQLINAIHLAS